VFIEGNVVVGNRVTIKSGVQLWDGVRLEDDVFVGPNATFTNDSFPRSKRHLDSYPVTTVRSGASIGANATILPGLTIERNAMIGAGAVVTKNVPPNAIVAGNPAAIVGYASTARTDSATRSSPSDSTTTDLGVGGARLFELPLFRDMRGSLSVTEFGGALPFLVKRVFFVFDVPSREVRGEHAHKVLEQFLVCVRGQVNVVVDDGKRRAEVILDRPSLGLYVPSKVWDIQYKYSEDALLAVLASGPYDAADYIRNYDEFLKHVSGHA
jgi:dTDP-4-dehydrorhamnose 3,5-epimerase-like enzyme